LDDEAISIEVSRNWQQGNLAKAEEHLATLEKQTGDVGRGFTTAPKTKTPQSGDCGIFDLVAGTGFEPVTFRL
jgi:hypothetical protein